jgi:hypothetical protein
MQQAPNGSRLRTACERSAAPSPVCVAHLELPGLLRLFEPRRLVRLLLLSLLGLRLPPEARLLGALLVVVSGGRGGRGWGRDRARGMVDQWQALHAPLARVRLDRRTAEARRRP